MFSLKTYYQAMSVKKREHLARRAKTSPAYLYQVFTGRRNPSVGMAKAISKGTDGDLHWSYFFPDGKDAE